MDGGGLGDSSSGNTGGSTNPSGGKLPGRPTGGRTYVNVPSDQWRPYKYPDIVGEDGEPYQTHPSPAAVLETYDPNGSVPPSNDKELGVLLSYRFAYDVRKLGLINWKVSNAFPSDSIIDQISKQRLLAHILDNKTHLPTAFREVDAIKDGIPKWNSVTITSWLINSLNHSDN